MLDQDRISTALFDEWAVIDGLLDELSEDAWLTPTALPGWTVHDVVAHLIGTESLLLGEQPPAIDFDPHSPAHVRNEIGAFNERWVEGLRRESGSALLARFRDVTGRRRDALSALDAREWQAPSMSPIGETTYGRFMRIRLFDCWMHELDIRDAVSRPGAEGDERARLAFEEIEAALGYIVGKRGKAPEGSRVTIELTDPLLRTIHIAVDGRAKVVEQLDDSPTSTIALSSAIFTRLCGGRTTADLHGTDIELSGDVEVGQHIVENLVFTI